MAQSRKSEPKLELVDNAGQPGKTIGSSNILPQEVVGQPSSPPEALTRGVAAAAEPPRKSPFEALESEIGANKPVSIFRDLEALKIEADEDDSEIGEEVLSTLPIRRPGKRAFRAHSEDRFQFEAFVLENIKDKVTSYVIPSVGKVLIDQAIENLKRVILVLCIGKSGRMFWWPVPGRGNFRSSGLYAAGLARDAWIKATGDLEQGGYTIIKMDHDEYGDPAWPAVMPSPEELLEITFHDNIITTFDHPELKAAKNV